MGDPAAESSQHARAERPSPHVRVELIDRLEQSAIAYKAMALRVERSQPVELRSLQGRS